MNTSWFRLLLICYMFLTISLHTIFSPIYVVPMLALYLAFTAQAHKRIQWVLPLIVFTIITGLKYWYRWEALLIFETQIAILTELLIVVCAILAGRNYREKSASRPQLLNLIIFSTIIAWMCYTALSWLFSPEAPAYLIYYVTQIQSLLQTLSYNLVLIVTLMLTPVNKELL